MSELEKLTEYYYRDQNYNCAETIIQAANDYYQLGITADDRKMFGGYGSGMYAGIVCGGLSACVAILSKMVIERSARSEADRVRPLIQRMVRNFREDLGGDSCKELRPKYYNKEDACLKTVLLSVAALEKTVNEGL